MNKEHHKWYSPALSRDMELFVYGHFGKPLLVFPSAQGRFFDYENNNMITVMSPAIEAGKVKVFCVDGIDAESWFNKGLPPWLRVQRHRDYENYLFNEFFPFAASHCQTQGIRVIATGSSFGAYHTMNFALKHPWHFSHLLCLSGNYDIRPQLDGYYSEDVYFQNPMDYLPNLNDGYILDAIRQIKIALVVGQGQWEGDCIDGTRRMSEILNAKGIQHHLDMWGHDTPHDWPSWRKMVQTYVPLLD
jgi:esterase/lipase superfamily enzyme